MKKALAVGALLCAAISLAVLSPLVPMVKAKFPGYQLKGYDIQPTGLVPEYPPMYSCSPLTSLYASWIDVDGTEREEQHSGVDGGREGDPILSPAPGVVKAVWKANWGWGPEGALLIRHTREDLNLDTGPKFYYSAFYHLDFDDISGFEPGEPVERGEELARVTRPGRNKKYLPEVHWEVWEIKRDDKIEWNVNEFGGRSWRSPGARLIDPLYMMSLEAGISEDMHVPVQPFVPGKDYDDFKGFTYILPCLPKKTSRQD